MCNALSVHSESADWTSGLFIRTARDVDLEERSGLDAV